MPIPRLLTIGFLLVAALPIAAQKLHPKKVYPEFGVGPTGIHATIEPGGVVTVSSIDPGSPAAATDLRVGDVLRSVRGTSLDVPDPRVPLGMAIGDAEADRGRFTLEISRAERTKEVLVRLSALGAYASTWPLLCSKSRDIVDATATYLAANQDEDGSYRLAGRRGFRDNVPGCVASLFLLSAGDARLPQVERHVLPLAKRAETRRNAGGHVNWQLGYQGILLSEYFLRTGDRRVLPGLQELCNWAVENQAAGGWGHGEGIGPGYVQSGLMNHAGLPILIALNLAQECGVEVDRAAYERAMRLMYRMAGHGCIAYGDHRSELGWSNTNGRNAMVACAFSLLQGRPGFARAPWHLHGAPAYRQAADHLGLLVADSYHQPEFGHTGGGFNVMWRGLGSVHAPAAKASHYRRQMDALRWYFDLCRQFGGGFSMPATPPDNKRYVGLEWGTGAVGLNYTAPRRTLRITGGLPTKHSRRVQPPEFTWGTDADLSFFSTDNADGFGAEREPPHVVYELLIGSRKTEATVEFAARHLRHYSPMVRTWAARSLGERDDVAALDALAKAAGHSDPRVRRAVYDAISGYDNWRRPPRSGVDAEVVSERFLPAIAATLKDPESAWWELDGALFALGAARPEDIRKHASAIERFARHEDWYLRDGAFWAQVGLHGTMTAAEFQQLTAQYARSRHVFERASYDGGFRALLRQDEVAYERVLLNRAVKVLGSTMYEPDVMLGYGAGGIHEAAHRTMMILKHFDPEVFEVMVDDFVAYLQIWVPYYQHSVWLITGSKWQPGILKVLEDLGDEGRPIVAELKKVLNRFSTFDGKRTHKIAEGLEAAIRTAVEEFEDKYGQVR